tara:strand:- start:1146 stop:1349 length:204 start_codon:yes stop_codon:yes gene_type:complete
MKGLDAHHYAVMDAYQDLIDREDALSALADAERARLLDLVIQVQGALVLNQQDIAMCILHEIENHLE